MDILTLHIIAVGCIIYLSYRYGMYRAHKNLELEMEEFLKKANEKPHPFLLGDNASRFIISHTNLF